MCFCKNEPHFLILHIRTEFLVNWSKYLYMFFSFFSRRKSRLRRRRKRPPSPSQTTPIVSTLHALTLPLARAPITLLAFDPAEAELQLFFFLSLSYPPPTTSAALRNNNGDGNASSSAAFALQLHCSKFFIRQTNPRGRRWVRPRRCRRRGGWELHGSISELTLLFV